MNKQNHNIEEHEPYIDKNGDLCFEVKIEHNGNKAINPSATVYEIETVAQFFNLYRTLDRNTRKKLLREFKEGLDFSLKNIDSMERDYDCPVEYTSFEWVND